LTVLSKGKIYVLDLKDQKELTSHSDKVNTQKENI